MGTVKMVVFDMAGTVVDEQNVVYKSLHQAMQEAGWVLTFEEVLRDAAGKEKRHAIIGLMREAATDEALVEQIYRRFLAILDAAYRDLQVIGQPGAIEIFDYLRGQGIHIVLNTGYNQAVAEQLIAKLGWQAGREYDLLVTASQVSAARPHPDMIHLAQQHFGIQDGEAVAKIGDSIIDIEEGRNAGCGLVLGITTGAHTRRQLETAQPDHVLDSLLELKGLI